MNPHTDHPDEGHDPAGHTADRAAGQPAGQPAGPTAETPVRRGPAARSRQLPHHSGGYFRHPPVGLFGRRRRRDAAAATASAALLRRDAPAGRKPAAEFLRLDPQPGRPPGPRALGGRRRQRHRRALRRRPADCPRHPDRPDGLRGRRRPPLRHRLGAAARTRRPHPRPGGRGRPVVVRDDRGPDHHGHRLPQPGCRRLGLGPLRLRRLHLDGLLGGWRHLPHLLPDPAQQVPERSHSHVLEPPARRPGKPRLPRTRQHRQRRQHRRLPSPPPATARRMRCPATASQQCPARPGARRRRRVPFLPPGAATGRCRAAAPSRRPNPGASAPAPPPSRSPPVSPCWWAAASKPSTSRTSSTSAPPATPSSGPAPRWSWAWASSSPASGAAPRASSDSSPRSP